MKILIGLVALLVTAFSQNHEDGAPITQLPVKCYYLQGRWYECPKLPSGICHYSTHCSYDVKAIVICDVSGPFKDNDARCREEDIPQLPDKGAFTVSPATDISSIVSSSSDVVHNDITTRVIQLLSSAPTSEAPPAGDKKYDYLLIVGILVGILILVIVVITYLWRKRQDHEKFWHIVFGGLRIILFPVILIVMYFWGSRHAFTLFKAKQEVVTNTDVHLHEKRNGLPFGDKAVAMCVQIEPNNDDIHANPNDIAWLKPNTDEERRIQLRQIYNDPNGAILRLAGLSPPGSDYAGLCYNFCAAQEFHSNERYRDQYLIINSTGDGNCLFNSISRHLCGTEDMALRLRLDTSIYILINVDKYVEKMWPAGAETITDEIEIIMADSCEEGTGRNRDGLKTGLIHIAQTAALVNSYSCMFIGQILSDLLRNKISMHFFVDQNPKNYFPLISQQMPGDSINLLWVKMSASVLHNHVDMLSLCKCQKESPSSQSEEGFKPPVLCTETTVRDYSKQPLDHGISHQNLSNGSGDEEEPEECDPLLNDGRPPKTTTAPL